MTPEEIEKLAEEKYPRENKWLDINHPNKAAFIDGYTTCQQTEVAERDKKIDDLQKELDRVKRLLINQYRINLNHNYDSYENIERLIKLFKEYNNL